MAEPPPGSPLPFGFSSMRSGSRCATRAPSATRWSMSRSASGRTERRRFSGSRIEQSEGAKFWLRVMNELKGRGVEDVLIAIVDGLKGFPEAITAVFPQAQVQICVVRLIRHSLAFVSYKDHKSVVAALKNIYKAKDADTGAAALEDFAEGVWGRNIRRSLSPGGATGRKSFRSLPSPTTSGGLFTPRIPLKV